MSFLSFKRTTFRVGNINNDDEDSGDDFGELHEKFAAQEKLLGELRGVLKSNSEKLETKEKVVKVRNCN